MWVFDWRYRLHRYSFVSLAYSFSDSTVRVVPTTFGWIRFAECLPKIVEWKLLLFFGHSFKHWKTVRLTNSLFGTQRKWHVKRVLTICESVQRSRRHQEKRQANRLNNEVTFIVFPPSSTVAHFSLNFRVNDPPSVHALLNHGILLELLNINIQFIKFI